MSIKDFLDITYESTPLCEFIISPKSNVLLPESVIGLSRYRGSYKIILDSIPIVFHQFTMKFMILTVACSSPIKGPVEHFSLTFDFNDAAGRMALKLNNFF